MREERNGGMVPRPGPISTATGTRETCRSSGRARTRSGSAPASSTARGRSKGVTPDLDRHCARVNASARTLGLEPNVEVETMVGLVREGMKRFPPDAALYIRPMYWAEQGGYLSVPADPASTRFLLCALRDADAAADRIFGHGFALSPADAWNPCRPTPRPAASIRTTAAPSWRRERAASTTRWCATCSATSPRPARRTSSW